MNISSFKNITSNLSKNAFFSFQNSWDIELYEKAKMNGGYFSFLNSVFGSPKKINLKNNEELYWIVPTTTGICAMSFRKNNNIENLTFYVSKNRSEDESLLDWKDFVSQLEVN